MTVMRYDELGNLLDKLEARGSFQTGDILMYFISPFLKSLGYDVFNIDEVDIQHTGVVTVTVTDGLKMIVTLRDENIKDDDVKILLRINTRRKEMVMSFKVIGQWENVVKVDLTGVDEDHYIAVTKTIMKENLEVEYLDKGERFLTEIVLNAQLSKGDWNNDFLKYSFINELEEPSDLLIELLARRLQENYTTNDLEWLQDKLGAIKEVGLLPFVKDVVDNLDVDITKIEQVNKASDTSNVLDVGNVEKEVPKKEEIVQKDEFDITEEDISDTAEVEDLSDMFDFGKEEQPKSSGLFEELVIETEDKKEKRSKGFFELG